MIAQEVEKVLPELVFEENGAKTVNYNSLMALTTSALKEELQATLDLEKSLKIYKNRLQKIKEFNHALKK